MATDMKRIVSPDSWGLGWGRAVTALPQLALPAPLSVAPSQPRSPSLDPLDPSALEGVAGAQARLFVTVFPCLSRDSAGHTA